MNSPLGHTEARTEDERAPHPLRERVSVAQDAHSRAPQYAYIGRSSVSPKVARKEAAAALSHRILNPSLTDPNYLVLKSRREILRRWCQELPGSALRVLDVGGRLQPYRPLLLGREELYVAIDPVFEGLLDVAGVGERLPFAATTFDLIICTQVLNYAQSPTAAIGEFYRVLKPEGTLYLSVPAIFPRYHDQRWHFMPDGLDALLAPFPLVEIVPEGGSIAGLFRMINLFFDTFVRGYPGQRVLRATVYPLANTAGVLLDRYSFGRSEFATNYCCRARKQPISAH